MANVAVSRLDFGYFVRPPEETGTSAPRVEACLGYLVEHPDGLILMDSGMGTDPDVDAHCRPARRPVTRGCSADAGVTTYDVTVVVNCHLHFDHCGGNPQLAGRTIVTQRVELQAARSDDYTLAELVHAPGLRYEELDGEAEILPGVLVVPTPGTRPDTSPSTCAPTTAPSLSPAKATTPPTAGTLSPGEQRRRPTTLRCRPRPNGSTACNPWIRVASSSPTTTRSGLPDSSGRSDVPPADPSVGRTSEAHWEGCDIGG